MPLCQEAQAEDQWPQYLAVGPQPDGEADHSKVLAAPHRLAVCAEGEDNRAERDGGQQDQGDDVSPVPGLLIG